MNSMYRQMARGLLVSAAICAPVSGAFAQVRSYQFELPTQNLGESLRAVTSRTGLQLYAAADDINTKQAPELRGTFTPQQAINTLLSGSGLIARVDGDAVIVKRGAVSDGSDNVDEEVIIVTGSRIKGARPVVPPTVITSQDIKMSGQSDLGEVARNLPISFGGGQNPGIGNTQGVNNENVNANGASTFNLRGIGPNATLTLLNGNRFGYTGVSAAIDVTSIPIAAVERVEIVADGSSAIYGADAVAGVVNIILKSNYSGVSASARVGASSDGGNVQQQYGMLAGTSWGSGSIMAAYDYASNTAINAEDRSYTSALSPQTDIYPAMNRHNLLVRARQDVGSAVKLGVDALFKTGVSRTETGYLVDRAPNYQGVTSRTAFETFGIAPTIDINLGGNWTLKAAGFYGTDRTDALGRNFSAGAQTSTSVRKYNNENLSGELGLQGDLINLPAGPLRIAVGGGYRSIRFDATTSSHFAKQRDNYFAYGEAYVPLINRDGNDGFLKSASITGALRFEDYSDSGQIVVPRLGLAVEPVKNVKLGLSWGKSFKLPTLFQQYSGYAAVLLGTASYGTTYPAGSTYIVTLGPNPNVGAERSENWTVSATITPVEGVEISGGYFKIDYRDRVAPPLASIAGALTNPLFTQFVTSNPSTAQQTAIITSANGGLQNATAGAYDPSRVVAILDARDANIAKQKYEGFDLSFRYGMKVGEGKKLTLSAGGTWLNSEQQLLPGLPTTPLAGTIFRPPEFRARGGITYDSGQFSLASFINHSGAVLDNRRAVAVDGKALTTFDLTLSAQLDRQIDVTLNALNIFNAKPSTIFTSSLFDTPFDTTNYSAAGRYFGLSVTGKW